MKPQKRSVYVIFIVVVLMGLLGLILWNYFIQADSTPHVDRVAQESKNQTSKSVDTDRGVKPPLTEESLEEALPDGCSLGVSIKPFEFKVDKLTTTHATSPTLGVLRPGEHGRVNEDKTWVYVAGGCGSNAGAFALKADSEKWKLVAYHMGDALFLCSKVDGLEISREVVGRCFDQADAYKERNILP